MSTALRLIFYGLTVFSVLGFVPALAEATPGELAASRRLELEQELKNIEGQIENQRKILEDRQHQSVSLERDIAILNAKIAEAKLSIRARNLSIEKLNQDISGKEKTIAILSEKMEREKDSLAQILRKTNDLDSYSLAEFALGGANLSDFFKDLDSFDAIKLELSNSFAEITDNKEETRVAKETLEEKKQEELDLRRLQELEKKKTEQQEKEKQTILKISRGLEKEYQKVLREKEYSAAAIRAELFQLIGSVAIPFEKALEYANEASKATGVRTAVILGIIAEESNLGQNVGTGNWRVDMHPTRDQPLFEALTRELGLNPDTVPVSKKVWYGYGGAMGPAQFIPSTWILYAGYECTKAPVACAYVSSKDRIGKETGNRPPNPWNPRDAFMGAAILMADNGAAQRTRASERLAALRYLAGWKNATKRAYAFYGNDVMELADKYQKQIDILKGSL